MAERENERSAQIVASRKTFRVFFARDDYFFKKEEKKKAIRRDREGERSSRVFKYRVCLFKACRVCLMPLFEPPLRSQIRSSFDRGGRYYSLLPLLFLFFFLFVSLSNYTRRLRLPGTSAFEMEGRRDVFARIFANFEFFAESAARLRRKSHGFDFRVLREPRRVSRSTVSLAEVIFY